MYMLTRTLLIGHVVLLATCVETVAQTGNETSTHYTLPVRIVAEPEEDQRAVRDRERSLALQEEDLAQQTSVASSTEDIVSWTKVQVALTALSLGGLFYTLFLTRRATKAAENGVMVAMEMGVKQVEGHLSINEARLWAKSEDGASFAPEFHFLMQNTGQSPIHAVQAQAEVLVLEGDDVTVRYPLETLPFLRNFFMLTAGARHFICKSSEASLREHMEGFEDKRKTVRIELAVNFKTIFGDLYRIEETYDGYQFCPDATPELEGSFAYDLSRVATTYTLKEKKRNLAAL
ncbi:hypothetical protein CN205_14785 [Sinorhizobium meliloti]|uniref:hypothetical protein n=1 Tax=Rhizobium meliloti TaxID=382 RepID=UPI000FD747A5|nr:hypothetical protein [Sinorhizobium meliloti]RVI06224.1 hypothetical protein CN205_14785 [Sinorhizobium meliloti]